MTARQTSFLLAILSGALLAFAFPDVNAQPLAFIALAPLLYALRDVERTRDAAVLGWLFGVTLWLINVPWVIEVMWRHGGLSLPIGIALYIAMAIYLGLYGALFTAIAHRLRGSFWIFIPLAWAAVEFIRSTILTGFPWHLVAQAIIDVPYLIQVDRWIGPYAVGFLIVLPSALIVSNLGRRTKGIALVSYFAVWLALGLAAERRLPTPLARAALIQPNISQQMRWDDGNLVTIYERMMTLTSRAVGGDVDVVIWPESTVPLAFASQPFYQQAIEGVSKSDRVDVILGSVAEDPNDPQKVWNAAYLVTSGETRGRYDKLKLVPFGEYVPLRKLLVFAEKLVRAVGEFQFGTNDRPIVGKHRYGPAICYEVVFPRIPATQVKNGATVLVTITNDGWFGESAAPRQHLNAARLRAIETDRYLLRAATTGISALVDPNGRIVDSLPMNQEGIIFGEFSPREALTPYVRFGDWFAILTLIAVGLELLRTLVRRNRDASPFMSSNQSI